MKASGHTNVVMHKRYLDLKPSDVAAAFGTGGKNGVHGNGVQEVASNGQERATAFRRRKVPGGAAGLQNWQARLKKVKREPGFINKP
jgi:hypothetical protein